MKSIWERSSKKTGIEPNLVRNRKDWFFNSNFKKVFKKIFQLSLGGGIVNYRIVLDAFKNNFYYYVKQPSGVVYGLLVILVICFLIGFMINC